MCYELSANIQVRGQLAMLVLLKITTDTTKAPNTRVQSVGTEEVCAEIDTWYAQKGGMQDCFSKLSSPVRSGCKPHV
jgi:hypothetical protein